jgi:hypothetical protein
MRGGASFRQNIRRKEGARRALLPNRCDPVRADLSDVTAQVRRSRHQSAVLEKSECCSISFVLAREWTFPRAAASTIEARAATRLFVCFRSRVIHLNIALRTTRMGTNGWSSRAKSPRDDFWRRKWNWRWPEHLSVYQTSPKLWKREAFEEEFDGTPDAAREPGEPSAGELGRLTVRSFFSAGTGLLAWSHIPVETAQ